MKQSQLLILLAGLAACPLCHAEDLEAARADVLALAGLTSAPLMREAEGFSSTETLKAVFYDALPWDGQPTTVFAWIGIPANREGKVPGIVLVHGGGGTAFKEWVQKWNDHGFAAISIAVEGQTDRQDAEAKGPANPQGWIRHAWAGPARAGIYGDSRKPLRQQWMYHAVADTILANSLLRSLPEVDPDRIGVMGISWGGVITSTVIGIDDRFAFAIPTYGCGSLADAANQYGRSLEGNPLYRCVWDPMVRLENVRMPVLWLSWPEDQHFPLDSLMDCVNAMPGESSISLIPGMRHGHGAAWNPPDSYAFAQSVAGDGHPWCRVLDSTGVDGAVSVSFYSAKPLDSAVLVSTMDRGFTGNREWLTGPAHLEQAGESVWKASATLPTGTTAWIINVHSNGLTMSSGYHEVD